MPASSCATQLSFYIIIWANTTHDTQARPAWPLCTTTTFGHTRRHGGEQTGVIYILGVHPETDNNAKLRQYFRDIGISATI